MKLYDISQAALTGAAFPGHPTPEKKTLRSISGGDRCNLTAFSMCAHNGTHIDAPFHFFGEGKTVDQMPLLHFVGPCFVARHQGDVTAEDAGNILEKARGAQRILIAGDITVTEEAALVFAEGNLKLIGNESQTVGPEDAPMQVHKILLSRDIALLEGVRLAGVPEGKYFLNAAPLNIAGADGAPCRAWLLKE